MAPKAWLLVASCIFLTAWPNEPTPAQVKQDLPSRIPNLAGYDSETRQTMELACIRDKASGAVAYSECLNRQIASLKGSPGIPNLSGYDSETRQTMELACIRDKASGPVAYSACLRKQIEGLSTVPRSQ
jgi:hypothetical protein